MASKQDWQKEISEAVRRENWSLSGPNRIVKVLPRGGSPSAALGGYIATGTALSGKTPREMERILGLPNNHLAAGARIYRFARLPMAHEYEYELTALYPGGLAFNPAMSDPKYPPGSRAVHQWRIKDGIGIPVDMKNFLELMPGVRFPYDWLLT